MSFIWKYIFAPQARKPAPGFWGYVTRKLMERGNREIIEKTITAVSPNPDESVLEMGFGFGIGLAKVLDDGLREGSGHLYGVDYSQAACDYVRDFLKDDLLSKKLTILNEDVAKMSIPDSSIDKAFHLNCFYFWDDIASAVKEILRVIKPGGTVVTGINLTAVKSGVERGILEESQIEPQRYIGALTEVGFIDVKQEDIHNEASKHLILIFATKPTQQ